MMRKGLSSPKVIPVSLLVKNLSSRGYSRFTVGEQLSSPTAIPYPFHCWSLLLPLAVLTRFTVGSQHAPLTPVSLLVVTPVPGRLIPHNVDKC